MYEQETAISRNGTLQEWESPGMNGNRNENLEEWQSLRMAVSRNGNFQGWQSPGISISACQDYLVCMNRRWQSPGSRNGNPQELQSPGIAISRNGKFKKCQSVLVSRNVNEFQGMTIPRDANLRELQPPRIAISRDRNAAHPDALDRAPSLPPGLLALALDSHTRRTGGTQ